MQWYIGTSGWSYTRWRGEFYPDDLAPTAYLSYYARYFDAVEINNSFYHLPTLHQIRLWDKAVPDKFTFCVKGSRYITHVKKLKDPQETLPPLMERLQAQKEINPVIFQLPPRFHVNLERLEEFLKALPKHRRYAMEFRDLTWHTEAVYALLRRYHVAFCLFEKAELRSPRLTTADFVYVRLHGRKENYAGNYSDAELQEWHHWLAAQKKDVYIFFDNTDEKLYAVENALTFQAMALGEYRDGTREYNFMKLR